MPKYILKRIVGTIPTLIIVVTFVFFFVRLIPGDPARLVAGEQATQDDVEAVREELGLNKSIPTQYVTYVTGLLKGNLGTSLRTKQPVTKEIAGRFGNTVRLAFVTLLWSSVVGVLFGVWSGTHRGKWQDYTGMTIAVSGISLPSFWIGFLLIMLFAVKLRILPTTSGTSLKSLIRNQRKGCDLEACFPQLHDLRRDGCGSAVRLSAGRFCCHRNGICLSWPWLPSD